MTDDGLEVLTFGECMACIRSDAPGPLRHQASMTLSCAGAESTVATGLARLGHRVSWVGRVGADEFGTLVAETLRGAGVNTRAIVDQTRPTGLMVRSARTPATVRVAYYRSGSAGAGLTADDVLSALGDPPLIVHATGITPALSAQAHAAVIETVRHAHAAGGLVSYDVNFRSRLTSVGAAAAVLRTLLPSIGILFFGEDELHVVRAALELPRGDIGALHQALPGRQLVLKRGRDGATAVTDNGQVAVASVTTAAVDAVGAGDAFVAGYLSATLDGLDVAGRLERAATLGAFSVSAHGDWEGLPTRAELSIIRAAPGFADR